ncbi:hypothetical protein P3W53_28545 [Pseudomonas denitrificans (nom. rej.)]|nr:hypothetical protein [Pseudomonas denitrificans (nom. rej.)]
MPEQTLKAYQVGDNDIVAAYDEAGAIKVLQEQEGGDPPNDYTLDEVLLVSDRWLDAREVFDTDEGVVVKVDKTLREEMAELTEPAYLCGWE